MDARYEAIKALYQEEIDVHKQHITDLEKQGKDLETTNAGLIQKIRDLQNLIEQAHVANKDLHSAFEHLRDENLKLQTYNPNKRNDRVANTNTELALETIQKQYVSLARDSVSWFSDKEKLIHRIKFLERESERYSRDNITLGKQVRHLLRCLEEERGMIIRRSEQVHDSEQPLCASDVIDQHLVTFESIEQLQQQNQKLLSLVKDLTKKEEEREIQIENEDIRRQNAEIDSLKSQLENIKNDREQIMNVFNTILKERDLFKILLCKTREVEHMTPEIFQRMVSVACSAGPAMINQPENTQDKDAHITDLKSMISKLENEIIELKQEIKDTSLRGQNEIKLKSELLEKAHLNVLIESRQAMEVKQRNEILESNLNLLNNEYEEMKMKCQKLAFELEKQAELAEEIDKVRLNCHKLQTELESSQSEVEKSKQVVSNLENKILQIRSETSEASARSRDELNNLTQQLGESEQMVADRSHQITELQRKNKSLESDINSLRNECQELKSKCQDDIQARINQSQLDSLRAENEKLKSEAQKLLIELDRMRTEISSQRKTIEDKESHLRDLESVISNLERDISQQQKELEQLRQLKTTTNISSTAPIAKPPVVDVESDKLEVSSHSSIEVSPIEVKPSEISAIDVVPVQVEVKNIEHVEVNPLEDRSIDVSSRLDGSIDATVIDEALIQNSPIQYTAIESNPVESHPVQSNPVDEQPIAGSIIEENTFEVNIVETNTTETDSHELRTVENIPTQNITNDLTSDHVMKTEPTPNQTTTNETTTNETTTNETTTSTGTVRPAEDVIVLKRRRILPDIS